MSRVIKCDRCGAEIEEGNLGYVSMLKRGEGGDLCGDNPFEKMDFCPDCMDKIAQFVSDAPKTRTGAVRSIEKPPQKKTSKAGKPGPKKIDTGKIRALADAGWTHDSIADEMGISTVTVRKYLKEES